MRPVRLELEGFMAFREPTVIDLAGAELFALVGPTGAGKSTVIDAVCFALYGSVPRLDRRSVDPVVSTGRLQARVRLDFSVGAETYTAVRVVRRLARGGATTKEARLERGDETLAGDADALTRAVSDLLGLGFEQFTTCVVLPQGDFARFLHDKPRDRQDLLVRLLELGVYDRMREQAGQRRAVAEVARDSAARQLESLAGSTPEALAAAAEHLARLEALRQWLDQTQPRLDALAADRRQDHELAGRLAAEATLLDAVAVPEGVAALSTAISAAQESAALAEAALRTEEERQDRAQAERAALGDPAPLLQAQQLAGDAQAARGRAARGGPILEAARTEEATGATEVAAAEARARVASDTLQAVRRAHAAHAVAAGLVVGEPCPVCDQPIAALPGRAAPAALADAQDGEGTAIAEHRAATTAQQVVTERRVRAEETMRTVEERLAELEAALRGAPSPEEAQSRLAQIVTADRSVTEAATAQRRARDAQRGAAEALAAALRRRDGARSQLATARDRVAALGPPAVEGVDLAADWSALVGWAGMQARTRHAEAETARTRAEAAGQRLRALEIETVEACEAEGVQVVRGHLGGDGGSAGPRAPRDACANALASQQAERDRIAADLERAKGLRAETEVAGERAAVAGSLGRHLAATGFERWLLDEALHRLVDGANLRLRELSRGQYSLAVDPQRNFAVVDHLQADERRPARTLSGGETFLASLALALSLAEQLVEMAVGSEPRLESMFLDEGFGTLDPDTLDVVAAALEELGSRGRMVGLVTHVRDLAERMPVRFEVRRTATGASVERQER